MIAPRLPSSHTSLASAVGGSVPLDAVIEGGPPDPPTPLGAALTVIAPAGASAASLAAQYKRDAAAIEWANGLVDGTDPAPGSEVLLPPGPGALVEVQPGELPSQFAERVHIDPTTLLAYNMLEADTPLANGSYLQVPLGSAPAGALNSAAFLPEAPGIPEVAPSRSRDAFPYGECTYYVATQRAITWAGNADRWLQNAKDIRPEGDVPVAGAVAVFNYWPLGHVAFVEQVNPDGSFVISEMNYEGRGRVDQRTIPPHDPSVVGFIY
ncbi:MAG: CHAP domain-containing protein [Candidatus Dormiibacterota bacterium]